MANPVKIDLLKNQWTLVATNALEGIIRIRQWQPDKYFITYRLNADPAPAGDQNEATSVRVYNQQVIISDTSGIDVYMYAYDLEGEAVVYL